MVEIWGEDEGRAGLKPITRRAWAPKGVRLIAKQCRRYQWLHVYAFVHPASGRSFWLLMPFVNTAVMTVALKQFAAEMNPDGSKVIVLLMDRAGWHVSHALQVPDGLVILPLPAHTPELQPAECAWPLVWESVANRPFTELPQLQKKLIRRCRYLLDCPDVVKDAVGFDWVVRAEERQHDNRD